MKFRKEHAAIIFLLVAFVVFFINVMVVVGDKNAKIHNLKKENQTLRELHEALERDHSELRKEKQKTINELREKLKQAAEKAEKENSPDNE